MAVFDLIHQDTGYQVFDIAALAESLIDFE